MEKELLNELKEKLLEEKERLEDELSAFSSEDPNTKERWAAKFPQFGDTTSEQDENEDEVEEYLTELPLEKNLETRLNDINEALKKIEKGAYGRCGECGEEIAVERLKVNPEAKTCIEHAE
ncbi:TraR/DksA C4-type zinc finger protein [Candidatus Azambacteria bacterium]|nr:TraR/DksA C4-type zinc finger protein [Candidatus Azambacteria bacterium]